MSYTSRTTREHKTPESNKSVVGNVHEDVVFTPPDAIYATRASHPV
jgi:hypothetical protein